MNALDATRRLLVEMPVRGGSGGRCYYCLGDDGGAFHQSDCPWLALPRIVQALEAAQRVVEVDPPTIEDSWCRLCRRRVFGFANAEPEPHAPDCSWLALETALGEDG